MKIKRLEIENYKIFNGKQVIHFPSDGQPAIFVGVNGAGKTTVIEAIIGGLTEFYFTAQGKETQKGGKFNNTNVNVNADEFSEVKISWQSGLNNNLLSGFKLSKTLDPSVKFTGSDAIKAYVESLKGDIGFHKMEASVPVLVYYPVERTVLNPSLKTRNIQGNQFDTYDNSFEKSIDFDDFFEWFRSTEDEENEIKLNKNPSHSDIGLDAVRKAIMVFLDDFTRIRVRRTGKTALIVEKKGKEFEVNQLSHGEKALIALVGDLARRLVIANPSLPNPLKGKGVVLIDEVDLHLHPKWQRTIMEKLQKTFPGIQFICTTHSPLVINHLNKESIFLLDNGVCTPLKEEHPQFNSYGADIEDVLEIVQGAEELLPSSIKVKFEELNETIQQNNLKKARLLIENLKKITDPNQSKLRYAETRIEYKELIK